MTDIVREAEELLAGVTPGPWHVVEGDEWTSDIATDTPEQGVWTVATANIRRDECVANKQFLSAAPRLVRSLLQRLRETEEEKLRLRSERDRRQMSKFDAAEGVLVSILINHSDKLGGEMERRIRAALTRAGEE